MAQESCNLDKEEPELLKPSSSPSPQSSSSPSSSSPPPPPLFPSSIQELSAKNPDKPKKPTVQSAPPSSRAGNRCSSCKRKVGLTGFRCRCGDLFCGQHRYSDIHDCSFDYKAFGREQISKANPVIRAAKIIKI